MQVPHCHASDMKLHKIAKDHDGFSGLGIRPLKTGFRVCFNCKKAIQKLLDDNNFLSWIVWHQGVTYESPISYRKFTYLSWNRIATTYSALKYSSAF